MTAHHVGQAAVMKRLVNNYNHNYNSAPTISVPAKGHTHLNDNDVRVSTSIRGFSNPRDLIARDIRELRRVYPDIPNSALKELISMNKKMYEEMR